MLNLAGKIENPLKSSNSRNSRNSCGFKYTVLHGNLSDSRVLECSGKLRSRRFWFFAGNSNSNFLSWLSVTKTKLIVQKFWKTQKIKFCYQNSANCSIGTTDASNPRRTVLCTRADHSLMVDILHNSMLVCTTLKLRNANFWTKLHFSEQNASQEERPWFPLHCKHSALRF